VHHNIIPFMLLSAVHTTYVCSGAVKHDYNAGLCIILMCSWCVANFGFEKMCLSRHRQAQQLRDCQVNSLAICCSQSATYPPATTCFFVSRPQSRSSATPSSRRHDASAQSRALSPQLRSQRLRAWAPRCSRRRVPSLALSTSQLVRLFCGEFASMSRVNLTGCDCRCSSSDRALGRADAEGQGSTIITIIIIVPAAAAACVLGGQRCEVV
jgi:hypothetical protein